MINVLASAYVRPGKRAEYLGILNANVPHVLKEKGCAGYIAAIDVDAGMPVQVLDENVVTIIERWESLEALRDHLASAHMLEYREKVKDMVEKVSLKVLQDA